MKKQINEKKSILTTKTSIINRNKISQEELADLRQKLKDKWLHYNHIYQKYTHRKHINYDSERVRKEELEKILSQIEADLKLLNHQNIELDSKR